MKTRQNLIIGFLSLWIILVSFLGFPSSVQRVLTIISALIIAFVSFWKYISESVNSVSENQEELKQ